MDKIDREFANYPVGQGVKVRIMVCGTSPLTAKAIDKLIKLLKLSKEDLSENASPERKKMNEYQKWHMIQLIMMEHFIGETIVANKPDDLHFWSLDLGNGEKQVLAYTLKPIE